MNFSDPFSGDRSQDYEVAWHSHQADAVVTSILEQHSFPDIHASYPDQSNTVTFRNPHRPQNNVAAWYSICCSLLEQVPSLLPRTQPKSVVTGNDRLFMSQENKVKRAALDKFRGTATEQQDSGSSQSLLHRPTGERKSTPQHRTITPIIMWEQTRFTTLQQPHSSRGKMRHRPITT